MVYVKASPYLAVFEQWAKIVKILFQLQSQEAPFKTDRKICERPIMSSAVKVAVEVAVTHALKVVAKVAVKVAVNLAVNFAVDLAVNFVWISL